MSSQFEQAILSDNLDLLDQLIEQFGFSSIHSNLEGLRRLAKKTNSTIVSERLDQFAVQIEEPINIDVLALLIQLSDADTLLYWYRISKTCQMFVQASCRKSYHINLYQIYKKKPRINLPFTTPLCKVKLEYYTLTRTSGEIISYISQYMIERCQDWIQIGLFLFKRFEHIDECFLECLAQDLRAEIIKLTDPVIGHLLEKIPSLILTLRSIYGQEFYLQSFVDYINLNDLKTYVAEIAYLDFVEILPYIDDERFCGKLAAIVEPYPQVFPCMTNYLNNIPGSAQVKLHYLARINCLEVFERVIATDNVSWFEKLKSAYTRDQYRAMLQKYLPLKILSKIKGITLEFISPIMLSAVNTKNVTQAIASGQIDMSVFNLSDKLIKVIYKNQLVDELNWALISIVHSPKNIEPDLNLAYLGYIYDLYEILLQIKCR